VGKYGVAGRSTDHNKCWTENVRFFMPDI